MHLAKRGCYQYQAWRRDEFGHLLILRPRKTWWARYRYSFHLVALHAMQAGDADGSLSNGCIINQGTNEKSRAESSPKNATCTTPILIVITLVDTTDGSEPQRRRKVLWWMKVRLSLCCCSCRSLWSCRDIRASQSECSVERASIIVIPS